MKDFADILRSRTIGLVLPREDDDQINRYVAMHSSGRQDIENRPFRRQVDFWAFCIGTALARNLDLREGAVSKWGKSFIYTNQGIIDNDLGSLLAVITVSRLGHQDSGIDEPGRIIELANRLAGAGCSVVLKELAKPDLRTTPLDRVLEFATGMQEKMKSVC